MEYAACRFLHTWQGPTITCSPPSAVERQRHQGVKSVCLTLSQHWLISTYMLHYRRIMCRRAITDAEEELMWFNSSSGGRTISKTRGYEYMTGFHHTYLSEPDVCGHNLFSFILQMHKWAQNYFSTQLLGKNTFEYRNTEIKMKGLRHFLYTNTCWLNAEH